MSDLKRSWDAYQKSKAEFMGTLVGAGIVVLLMAGVIAGWLFAS